MIKQTVKAEDSKTQGRRVKKNERQITNREDQDQMMKQGPKDSLQNL